MVGLCLATRARIGTRVKKLEAHWEIKDHHISFGIDAPVDGELVVNGKPLHQYTDEEVEELRQDYFDSWCWKTGSVEERTIYESLCKEIEKRKTLRIEWEVPESMAKVIRADINDQILNDIRLIFDLNKEKSDD